MSDERCERCVYFADRREPEKGDNLGYCQHAAVYPKGLHAIHAEYGGFWTDGDSSCSEWEKMPETRKK